MGNPRPGPLCHFQRGWYGSRVLVFPAGYLFFVNFVQDSDCRLWFFSKWFSVKWVFLVFSKGVITQWTLHNQSVRFLHFMWSSHLFSQWKAVFEFSLYCLLYGSKEMARMSYKALLYALDILCFEHLKVNGPILLVIRLRPQRMLRRSSSYGALGSDLKHHPQKKKQMANPQTFSILNFQFVKLPFPGKTLARDNQ